MPTSQEVADERAIETRYAQSLASKSPGIRTRAIASRHRASGSSAIEPDSGTGELLGRVAIGNPHPLIDGRADFYISSRYVSLPDLAVYSWSAPVACTFFRGDSHHELCDEVVAVRTFERTGGRISGFSDDIVGPADGPPFGRRVLTVPRPPSATELPVRRHTTPVGDGGSSPVERLSDSAEPVRAPTGSATGLRAEVALLRRLRSPRAASLAPVLATLQPDQYSVTTAPFDEPLMVDGKPGTGKTVVAIHRAAYLVSPDSGLAGRDRVLLLGPTPQYARHVMAIRDQLVGDSDRLVVSSIPELLDQLIAAKRDRPRGKLAYGWQDVDSRLAVLVSDALGRLRRDRRLSGNATQDVRQTFDLLRSNGEAARVLTNDDEWRSYLARLPAFPVALERRSLQPLLAWISWKVNPSSDFGSFSHIVVDEAQDILPLEWTLLDAMNSGGAWTILGDMNQRRSDYALHTWTHVADELGILDDDGLAPLRHLERGYRSTQPIIQYANRLLPRSERAMLSLQQEGDAPDVTRVSPKVLASSAAARAEQLAALHPTGTVAVISVGPDDVRQVLRRGGWLTTRSPRTLAREGIELTVLHPDDARGLEFDAVVVVEPASFTPNVGRHGQLYTALSRANRSLSVVHSQPLPEALKDRRR